MAKTMWDKLAHECSDFLSSCKYPLIKVLKKETNCRNIKKVKVRTKRRKDTFIKHFNEAFSMHNNIHGRSVFCNGKHSEIRNDEYEKVYVFPINGFRFLYNPDVEYHLEYEKIRNQIQESTSLPSTEADKLFIDMLEYSYKNNNISLSDAAFNGNEIIIYNIPYYYAIRKNKFQYYEQILNFLKK